MTDLCSAAAQILTERFIWETQCRISYRMRHQGLPRIRKPFPGCADGHVAVIDKAIRKQKPFWSGQIEAGDRLCTFNSMRQQMQPITDAAADYYDFETRDRSPFLDEMESAIDPMLLYGRGILKCTIDPLNDYALVDEAIEPMFIIMPEEANDFDDAEQWVHCREFTVSEYRRLDDRWDTSEETVARIKGTKDWQQQGIFNLEKRLREGIVFNRFEDMLLVWEHWTKDSGGWMVHYYSPANPDIELRASHPCPYKVGGKPSCPFFSFQMEVVDKGWYAPRGLGELLAPWEQYQTKLFNEKADNMTFTGRPLFTGSKEIQNGANIRFEPGEYIPGDIKSVEMQPPAVNFNSEAEYASQQAEEIAQSPDFGITQQGPAGGKARTATENDRIAALNQAGTVYNGKAFRRKLTKIHRHRWGMRVQFKPNNFAYFASGQCKQLPEQALHNEYLIMPDGSPDAWNPLARLQKFSAFLQMVAGFQQINANINWEVMAKRLLNDFDGRLALDAFSPTSLKGATEYESAVLEINSMIVPGSGKPSFPPPVKPEQDHATRLKACADWMHAAGVLNTPLDPTSKTNLHAYMAQHMQMLQQQNPDAAKQTAALIQKIEATPIPGGAQPNGASSAPPATNSAPPGNGQPQKLPFSISGNFKDLPPDAQQVVLERDGLRAPGQMPQMPPIGQPQLTPARP